jgi:hypothetical protein
VKKLLVIFLIATSYCFAQSNTNSEKTWLIDYYFKQDKELNEQLSSAFNLTIAGKYPDAKTSFIKQKASIKKTVFPTLPY